MKTMSEAPDDSLENVRARRNHLVAHWAAERMGFDELLMRGYGRALHEADYEEPGDGDVLRKLKSDMALRGIEIEEAELGRVIRECHQRALRDTHSTD